MIRSFRNKGLGRFFRTGDKRGIRPEHAARLSRILDRLDAAVRVKDMDLPGYRLHPLKADRVGEWAVSVSGNWRVIFRFEGPDIVDIDYDDYH